MRSFLKSYIPPIYYILYCKNKKLYPKTRFMLTIVGAFLMALLLSKITLSSLFIFQKYKTYVEILTFVAVCKCLK